MADLTVTAAQLRELDAVKNRRITGYTDVALTKGQAVYRKTNKRFALARGNAVGTSKVLGIATADAAAGTRLAVEALWQGGMAGFDLTGVDSGETVYLSTATAGALQDVAPAVVGTVIVPVGTVHTLTDNAETKYILFDIPQNAEPAAIPAP